MFRILVGPHRTPSRVHSREYYEQGECLQGPRRKGHRSSIRQPLSARFPDALADHDG